MARAKSDLITHGRRLNDLGVALVESTQQAGGDDDDACEVFSDGVLWQRLGLLVMGKLNLVRFPSEIHAARLIPRECLILEDVEPTEFNFADLEFVSFLEDDDEGSIDGPEMRRRAVALRANMGLCDCKQILARRRIGLPENTWNKIVAFPGTVLRDEDGYPSIPCLVSNQRRPSLVFCKVHNLWNNISLLARIKQPGQTEAKP